MRKISRGINPPEKKEGDTIYVDVHLRGAYFFARAYSIKPFKYQRNFICGNPETGKSKAISTKPCKAEDWATEWWKFLKYLERENNAKISGDHCTEREKETYQRMVKTW